ncbi:hypothetical protein XENOCAPTIV_013811 [Xenoophorus captivus]|uniref:Uncharacterized protein n=1 Tax=Xenoophorus captivus TaxID=1517983 RepID=A0ABV0S8U2_9TELE
MPRVVMKRNKCTQRIENLKTKYTMKPFCLISVGIKVLFVIYNKQHMAAGQEGILQGSAIVFRHIRHSLMFNSLEPPSLLILHILLGWRNKQTLNVSQFTVLGHLLAKWRAKEQVGDEKLGMHLT